MQILGMQHLTDVQYGLIVCQFCDSKHKFFTVNQLLFAATSFCDSSIITWFAASNFRDQTLIHTVLIEHLVRNEKYSRQ
jgi:hypothetical protein